MAQIELRLSNRVQKETSMSEVMICLRYSRHDLSAKSGIFVNPDYFEYYINRKATKNPRLPLPENKLTATIARASKSGWELRKSGIIVTRTKGLQTADVEEHNRKAERMESLKKAILTAFNESTNKESLTSDWLNGVVESFHNSGKTTNVDVCSFFDLAERFLVEREIAENDARVYRVLFRAVARFEGFVRLTKSKDFRFDINSITRETLEDFTYFLQHEKEYSETFPSVFEKLLSEYPIAIKGGKPRNKVQNRGSNTVIKMRRRLKLLFSHFIKKGLIKTNPFEGIAIGTERVGEPVYISCEERNVIAEANLSAIWDTMPKEERKKVRMSLKTLEQQRDIFVFHCLVGARVGDLIRLTEGHINDGMLVYTPHKTRNSCEEVTQARVPLHPKALALIKKYRGSDGKGRLFPFVTPQRYNDALKVVFKMAGITRLVEVRNSLTGEAELVPINTIASSHMARRSFVGGLYFRVADPNLIGRMSGHSEGSKAFRRYRRIEDQTLRNVINLIG